ncbi:MAG TPA: glycosyltransferase family 39 protein [Candidatus Sulfopaludibacter sp.]|nr:glycosyltransferase family 39 protein [Candidatus Sulfopaludibacter sp.]
MILISILFGAAFTVTAAYGFGSAALRRLAAPPEIALAVGAVLESMLVFLALLCGVGYWPVYLALGAGALAASAKFRGKHLDGLRWKHPVAALFAAYGVFYLVNAMAPEALADGITYHLGLPYEYTRLGRFSSSIEFYHMLPQGMEMLFTMAFAFGRHSAAKLVEFAIFIAGVPLIFRIGRRLGMNDVATLVAAVFYFTAPVIALTGTTSYNDAALVFFTLAAFYMLLVWRDTADARYLLPAGLLAGFCYAIKFPGVFTVAGAVLFVLCVRPQKAFLVVAGAGLAVAPWAIRSAALTGNPAAPLMNSTFRNRYFHVATEVDLAKGMRSMHEVPAQQVPWELAFGDRFMGTFGPLLFALPLGLPAIYKRSGRLCLAAAVILAIPWYSNTGARFLMPSFTFAGLALGMALPRPAAWAAIAIQAIGCVPALLDTRLPEYQFRLHEFPWRAALRLESEQHYLELHIRDYGIARMVERNTPAAARIFSLIPLANAYLARDVTTTWTSAEGDRMIDNLRVAALYPNDWFFDWKGSWPPQSLRALRFRMPASFNGEWDISEVELLSDGEPIFDSPQWTLRAWPNRWETPLAFDHLNVTRWRTWEPIRRGNFFEIDLDHPQLLSGAVLKSHTPVYQLMLEFYGQNLAGKWLRLTRFSDAVALPPIDLRTEAAKALRRAGFRYLVAPVQYDSYAQFGRRLREEAPQWGLEEVADAGPAVLFRIR